MTTVQFAQRSLLLVFAGLFSITHHCAGAISAKAGGSMVTFEGPAPSVDQKDPNVKYDLNPASEKFYLWTPAGADKQVCGLIVFIHADDSFDSLPVGWDKVLSIEHLMLLAPQNAGNDQPVDRRLGLAAMGARLMMAKYQIDPERIYSAGLSGGARMAGRLGFFEPNLFHGTIQCCGADFYTELPKTTPRGPLDKTDDDDAYGKFSATQEEIDAAKKNVKFNFITGSKDFRHAHILDIYHDGYEKAAFHARLADITGGEHAICGPGTLATALLFFDTDNKDLRAAAPGTAPGAARRTPQPNDTPAPATGDDPPAPAWGAKDPSQWPGALLYNDGALEGNMGIGGSGCLFRLPNKAVVAGTVLHVFGEETKLDELQAKIKSWSMISPASRKKLVVKKLAMNIDPANPVDCVIANVSQSSSYPAEVLTPRVSVLTVGEVVYVPGMPNGGERKVSYHKATVATVTDSRITYVFDPQVDTNGFSGAAILDSHGLLVGIHQGHLNMPDGSKAWYGFPIAAAVAVCNAGPPAGVAAKAPLAGGSSDDAAAKASRALDMAENYVTLGKYDLARTKLQDIITNYPNTPAAKKAKAALAEIAAK
jgi:hypothetical protein